MVRTRFPIRYQGISKVFSSVSYRDEKKTHELYEYNLLPWFFWPPSTAYLWKCLGMLWHTLWKMVYWKRDYMLYYSSFTCRIFMSETSKKNTQINFWLEIIVVTYIVIYWVEKSHYCIEHNFTYLESFMVGTIPLFLPGNSTTFRGNTLSSLSTSLSFWMISLVWFFFSLKMRIVSFSRIFFLKVHTK